MQENVRVINQNDFIKTIIYFFVCLLSLFGCQQKNTDTNNNITLNADSIGTSNNIMLQIFDINRDKSQIFYSNDKNLFLMIKKSTIECDSITRTDIVLKCMYSNQSGLLRVKNLRHIQF